MKTQEELSEDGGEDSDDDVSLGEIRRRAALQLAGASSSVADDSPEEEEEEEEEAKESKVKHLTLGERLSARRESGSNEEAARRPLLRAKKAEKTELSKRSSKNAPMEMSSKKTWPQKRKRQVETTRRDPRFEEACGKLRPDAFEERYNFLKGKEAVVDKGPEGEKLRTRLAQLEREARERKVIADLKKEERAKVAKGKNPYYFKRSVIKKHVLNDRFETLRATGKLDKFMRRRRAKLKKKQQFGGGGLEDEADA